MSADYRRWLERWQEQAVRMLPSSSPPALRVEVREAIAQALMGYGPDDAPNQIQDIVDAMTQQVRARLEEEEAARQREVRKKKQLECAEILLELALNRCPVDLVGPPKSDRRHHVLRTLRRQMHETLSAELTGDEPITALIQKVNEGVATWIITENPRVDRRTAMTLLTRWGIPVALAGAVVAFQVPPVRAAVTKGLEFLQTRLAPYGELLRAMREASGSEAPPAGERKEPHDGAAD